MSYRSSCRCRAKTPGGLGATDEDFYGTRDFVIQFINGVNGRIQGFADTSAVRAARAKVADAQRWFQSAVERFYGGNTPEAMERLNVATRMLHEASALINALRPEDRVAAQAQAQTQAGASFSYQVGRTVGELTDPVTRVITEPIASAVEAVSPAAAAAVRSSGIALPVVAGLALFLLLRR